MTDREVLALVLGRLAQRARISKDGIEYAVIPDALIVNLVHILAAQLGVPLGEAINV